MMIILIAGVGEWTAIVQNIEEELRQYLQGFLNKNQLTLEVLKEAYFLSLAQGLKCLLRMRQYLEMNQHKLCMFLDSSSSVL